MTRRIWFIGLWVVAALVATGVALAAVGSVAGEVTDSPASPQLDAAGTSLVDTSSTSSSLATSTMATSTTGAPGSSTSTSDAPGSSTSTSDAPDGSSTSTSTTDAPDQTSTTAAPGALESATYQLEGGWVRILYGGGIVDLDAAAPYAGFTMDVEDSGPEKVRVEFRSDDHRSEIDIEWDGGSLNVETEEEDE